MPSGTWYLKQVQEMKGRCYECGSPQHLKYNCSKLVSSSRGNGKVPSRGIYHQTNEVKVVEQKEIENVSENIENEEVKWQGAPLDCSGGNTYFR